MALRKASSYSKKKYRPYTRKSKVKKKSYIKTVPQQKIVKFVMGNTKAFQQKKLKLVLKLVAGENVQIRDNALEASRQVVNKILEKSLAGMYYFVIKTYPHQILRENKMYSGGSKGERINLGMSKSFGKTTGRAAIVKPNQDIFVINVGSEKGIKVAREALKKVKPKIPCKTKIVYEKGK